MKISYAEFERIANAIAFAITRIYYSTTGKEPTAAFVTLMAREMVVDYLDSLDVEEVEDEDEEDEPDFPDDVDETNYDPYCGCDIYEPDREW